MNLENIMLSEISQSQKDKFYMIPLKEVLKVVLIIKTDSRMVIARVWGEEGTGIYCLTGMKFQFSKTKWVLEMDSGDSCTTI